MGGRSGESSTEFCVGTSTKGVTHQDQGEVLRNLVTMPIFSTAALSRRLK